MQYLLSQWKCKHWWEMMEIFREQTDPTQLNAARESRLSKDWPAALLWA